LYIPNLILKLYVFVGVFPFRRLTNYKFLTRLKRRVPLVGQQLLTLPEHLSSSPVLSGVRVTRSLVLCACFVDRCLFFCTFTFGHCVVCLSSIYEFWLSLWYFQTLLTGQASLCYGIMLLQLSKFRDINSFPGLYLQWVE
jgi:hypothetical protein